MQETKLLWDTQLYNFDCKLRVIKLKGSGEVKKTSMDTHRARLCYLG